MIYYRLALQIDETPTTWKWKSTVLTSLDALFSSLKTFQAIPTDQMRVFLSSSPKGWDEMLTRQNKGLLSNSLTAEQVLNGYRICPHEVMKLELELGTDGDYDVPYEFTPPTTMKQKLAWAKLLTLVSTGELQP